MRSGDRASPSYLPGILRSTFIVGAAGMLTILAGLVRAKAIALLVGPAGTGLLGLYQGAMNSGAQLGSAGLGFSGVRELAADEGRRGEVRRALWRATVPLALATTAAMWFARAPIAHWVTGSDRLAFEFGLVGVAAGLSVIGGLQGTILQGYGRVGGLAWSRIGAAVFALVVGVAAVAAFGEAGLVLALLAIPLGSIIAALPFRPAPDGPAPPGRLGPYRALFTLGLVTMVTSTASALAALLIRTLIARDSSIEAAGHFQAAFALGSANVALILSAMAADYFPRLSSLAQQPEASRALVNQQLRVALLLGLPILIATAALASLLIPLFYSGAFAPAESLLRWQLVGELLKIPCWTLGFLLVARNEARAYLLCELLFCLVYVGATAALLPLLGLDGAGVAYALAHLAYGTAMLMRIARHGQFGIEAENRRAIVVGGAMLLLLALFARHAPWPAAAAGVAASLWLGWRGVGDIHRHTGLLDRVPALARWFGEHR